MQMGPPFKVVYLVMNIYCYPEKDKTGNPISRALKSNICDIISRARIKFRMIKLCNWSWLFQ